MLVSHILKSKGSEGVVTVQPGLSVAEAAEVLSQRKIGALVISRDGKTLGGIISERDIVREIGRRGKAQFGQIVQFLVKDHVRDIAHQPMRPQIGTAADRRMGGQIGATGGQMQAIIGQLLHGQPPGLGAGHANRHVRLALGQVEDPRQRDKLHLKARIGVTDPRQNLWQKVICTSVRGADADQPGQPLGTTGSFRHAAQRGLCRLGLRHQPSTRLGQGIALRAFDEQPKGKRLFQPGNAATDRGGVDLEPLARSRQAFAARHRQKHPQIIPVHQRLPP